MAHRHEHLCFTSQLWLPYPAFCFDLTGCFQGLCIWSRIVGSKSSKLQYVLWIMTTAPCTCTPACATPCLFVYLFTFVIGTHVAFLFIYFPFLLFLLLTGSGPMLSLTVPIRGLGRTIFLLGVTCPVG